MNAKLAPPGSRGLMYGSTLPSHFEVEGHVFMRGSVTYVGPAPVSVFNSSGDCTLPVVAGGSVLWLNCDSLDAANSLRAKLLEALGWV